MRSRMRWVGWDDGNTWLVQVKEGQWWGGSCTILVISWQGWICERMMAQCQLNISPILALVHTIHPACARLISWWPTSWPLASWRGCWGCGTPGRHAQPGLWKGTNYLLGSRRLMVVGWSRWRRDRWRLNGVPVCMLGGTPGVQTWWSFYSLGVIGSN